MVSARVSGRTKAGLAGAVTAGGSASAEASGCGAQEAPVASSRTARASSFSAPNSSVKLGSTEAGLVAQRAYCSPRNAAFAPEKAEARMSTPAMRHDPSALRPPLRRPRIPQVARRFAHRLPLGVAHSPRRRTPEARAPAYGSADAKDRWPAVLSLCEHMHRVCDLFKRTCRRDGRHACRTDLAGLVGGRTWQSARRLHRGIGRDRRLTTIGHELVELSLVLG